MASRCSDLVILSRWPQLAMGAEGMSKTSCLSKVLQRTHFADGVRG
jgi:hypothetical protein